MIDHSRAHDELEDHDLGLCHDLPQIVEKERRWGRRWLLGLMGGVVRWPWWAAVTTTSPRVVAARLLARVVIG